MTKKQALETVREVCLALPETSERPSHGAPTFFVAGKRSLPRSGTTTTTTAASRCCAPRRRDAGGARRGDPERFFVPPYVGHRGLIGVRLDRGFARDEIAGILEDAYADVAPRKLVKAAERHSSRAREPEVGLEPTT